MVEILSLRKEISPISPTILGNFIKLQRCEQYLGWELLADDVTGEESRFSKSILSPLYAETGTQFEYSQLRSLINQIAADKIIGPEDKDIEGINWDETWNGNNDIIQKIKNIDESGNNKTIIAFQPSLKGKIGSWELKGYADIVIIKLNHRDQTSSSLKIQLEVIEVKSSPSDKTHHRIQAACYTLLLKNLIENEGEINENIKFSAYIVNQSNSITNKGYSDLDSFKLPPVETDVQMILKRTGRLENAITETGDSTSSGEKTIKKVDPWDMFNRITRRCDGCPYENVCYTRAVENDGLELLGIPERTKKTY